MNLDLTDLLRLIHPIIAVAIVFPLIGIVVNMAWQTRQRRLETTGGGKSKIPPLVGPEHLKYGRWLAGGVVGLCLLGMLHPSVKYILKNNLLDKEPSQVAILALLFVATIGSLVCLFRARQRLWIVIFTVLASLGVLLLGFQDTVFARKGFGAIFRLDNEWFWSHFYFGMAATLLMIFSLAIIQDIYRDRSNRWRTVHVILNCFALLLFLAQAFTGTRDLLSIPFSWQEPYIYSCNFEFKTCPTPNK
ncbi:DUF4079 domain-containing protein [Tumidithrix elongata RA019]|uniref:DUF4079 domain-containing protein n=1 Tax=Tumidithrix elongata BACA0141 TaxID=2716417 RepID=A0AAW9PWC6_9CYAN|nr:DUF4079 domain-containing protein [Tumidithrix elongata RA019]